ncbi:DNA adenine methylase [Cellulosimicrobium sp. TH-20]|uniref:DNA adenine methylase n=1 Tax=Cellulosimicrobium sp. TH-20 TaxID=1980001 RepID=UPI0011A07847|nr:DNA adenine methylase [Cellulosimicrobium sp. TH-20]
MDYLGNKVGLAQDIVRTVQQRTSPGAHVADLFAGTASVSLALANAGFRVTANDILPLSVTWSKARLTSRGADFSGLSPILGHLGEDPLASVVAVLDDQPGSAGWVTQNYSPASLGSAGVERRYLTTANARRIDAIRLRLREWRPLITDAEHALLMTTLLEAVSAVSNIAGTYGCYLKEWKSSALKPLRLQPYRDIAEMGSHQVVTSDAETVASEITPDAIYADPPYTKRQYAAYYHLLNSIASDVESHLVGSTGLPDWRPLASDWCYKRKAPAALERLVAKSAAPVIVLSYSSDGHIPHETIRKILGTYGDVDVQEFEWRRYRSSQRPHRTATVSERLYVMQR